MNGVDGRLDLVTIGETMAMFTPVEPVPLAEATVLVGDLTMDRPYRERYDELILATGASAVIPPVPGIDQPGHFTLRTIPDMDRVIDWISERRAKRALILGGGFIGL